MAEKKTGLNLKYERFGSGSPLLLIGGLGCDKGFWKPFQVPAFSQHHEVIVYDNRGIGESDKPQGPYTTEMLADDAADLLDTLGLDRVHVLGVSMGGMISLQFAIRHPERTRSLVVACGTGRSDAWMKAKQAQNQQISRLPVDEAELRDLVARMNLLWMVAPSYFDKPENIEMIVAAMKRVQQPLEAYRSQSQALHDHDASAGLETIKCPTMVMVGKQDILTPVRYAEAVAKTIPNAELQILDGCGHLFMFEKPAEFNACVLDFLKDVERRESRSLSDDETIQVPDKDGQVLTAKIRTAPGSNRWALIGRGLTGKFAIPASPDQTADALERIGWSSLRFDYRRKLDSPPGPALRTPGTMLKDMIDALSILHERIHRGPDVIIAKGFAAPLALQALKEYPQVPLILWAPILWLRTSLELRYRLHEVRRQGRTVFDNAELRTPFIDSVIDPTDEQIKSWIVPGRRHIILHGQTDQVVPYRLALETKELIEAAGGRVELLDLPGTHPHPGANVNSQLRTMMEIVEKLS